MVGRQEEESRVVEFPDCSEQHRVRCTGAAGKCMLPAAIFAALPSTVVQWFLLLLLALALAAPAAAKGTSQTITFAPLADQIYGAAPFTVSATASSGLPVTFASTTAAVCTVSGSTVTLVAAGTCTVQATQAGNATYAAAPKVNRSFSVAKASQTITFGALHDQALGTAPFTITATASSGLAVALASTTKAVCTVNAGKVTLVLAGVCTIQASQAGNANYSAATVVAQSFTVTGPGKLSQTITFAALGSQPVTAPPFSVTATATSGLAVSFASLATTVCSVSGNIVTLVSGGICTLRASQAGDTNYLAAPNVDQSFTATLALQTIAFAPLIDVPLSASPVMLGASASSGLPVSFTSLTTAVCTVSANAVALAAVGTCTIRAAQEGDAVFAPAPNVERSFVVAAAVDYQLQFRYDAVGNLIQATRAALP